MKPPSDSFLETIRPQARISPDEIERQALITELDESLSEEEKNRRHRLLAAGLLPSDILPPPTRPQMPDPTTDMEAAKKVVALGLGIEPEDLLERPFARTFWGGLIRLALRDLKRNP